MTSSIDRKKLPIEHRLIAYFLIALVAFGSTYFANNALLWLALTIGVIFALLTIGNTVDWLATTVFHKQLRSMFFPKLALVVAGCMLAIVFAEIYLAIKESSAARDSATASQPASSKVQARLALVDEHDLPLAREAARNILQRDGVLTMPETWKRRPAEIDGAYHAYYWHDALHVYDTNMFRRTAPFPPRAEDTFRIMVIGDSMTYGYGVDEQFIYVRVLEDLLRQDFRAEVLNLGKSGWQSEDILEVLREFLPVLKPDLVIYGVVHNDFLPSAKGQYKGSQYAFPIPEALEQFFVSRSRFARFTADAYDALLRQVGLRKDFFDDILEDFEGYQQRFGEDVKEMNRLVIEAGLPPIIGIVLDQYPQIGGRGQRISTVAEDYMEQASIKVVPIEEYYNTYNNHGFYVSHWEGHADEQAHAIFASLLLPYILDVPELQSFKKEAAKGAKK